MTASAKLHKVWRLPLAIQVRLRLVAHPHTEYIIFAPNFFIMVKISTKEIGAMSGKKMMLEKVRDLKGELMSVSHFWRMCLRRVSSDLERCSNAPASLQEAVSPRRTLCTE